MRKVSLKLDDCFVIEAILRENPDLHCPDEIEYSDEDASGTVIATAKSTRVGESYTLQVTLQGGHVTVGFMNFDVPGSVGEVYRR